MHSKTKQVAQTAIWTSHRAVSPSSPPTHLTDLELPKNEQLLPEWEAAPITQWAALTGMSAHDLKVNFWPPTHFFSWAAEKHPGSEVLPVNVSVCVVYVHSMFLCRHIHVYERKSLREKEEQEQRIWQQPHTVQMKDTHSALNSNCSSLWMVTILAERTEQSWESSIAFSGAVSPLALS